MIDEKKLVSANIFDPGNSFFKQPANERAICTTISCSLDDCTVRDRGECIMVTVLGWQRCPYGSMSTETGLTRRARGYDGWIKDKKERYADIPQLGLPKCKMAFIGDYVYLPYAHMTMCKRVDFTSRASLFVSGDCMLSRDYWSAGVALTLIDFRPQAIMGGEIRSYQEECVPLFIQHLREIAPDTWSEIIKIRPSLDVEQDYVGRTAILSTLRHPIEWTTRGNNYPVTWKWDGLRVTTSSTHAYNSTWGRLALSGLDLSATVTEKTTVVVQDNAWVTDETVFVD